VADLIDYALGQITPDERRRIENHLNGANCPQCRGWIEKTARLRGEPWPEGKGPMSSPVHLAAGPSPAPAAARAPAPESSWWQQEAFRELERRLRQLEE